MAGIDEILGIIDARQKETESVLISSAEKKSAAIRKEGDEKALKAYEEQLEKGRAQLERDLNNAYKSADASMKRRILACKVECIDAVIDKTVEKLKNLPDKEYFELIRKLAQRLVRSGDGIVSLSSRDLSRMPENLENELNEIAKKTGGTIKIDRSPADIEDGFILSYGLISENCSFRAVIEAEKDSVRDTAARVLFG